jgi:hypothetical protein
MTLTGYVEVIQMLNRLGHGISYEVLLTAWKGFIPWLEANFANQMKTITVLMLQVWALHNDIC